MQFGHLTEVDSAYGSAGLFLSYIDLASLKSCCHLNENLIISTSKANLGTADTVICPFPQGSHDE